MADSFPLLYRRPRLLAATVFLLCLALSALVVWNLEQNHRHNLRADIENIAQNHAFLLRDSLRQALTLNYSMATLVRLSQGQINAFEAVARDMLLRDAVPAAMFDRHARFGADRFEAHLDLGRRAASLLGHHLPVGPAPARDAQAHDFHAETVRNGADDVQQAAFLFGQGNHVRRGKPG